MDGVRTVHSFGSLIPDHNIIMEGLVRFFSLTYNIKKPLKIKIFLRAMFEYSRNT